MRRVALLGALGVIGALVATSRIDPREYQKVADKPKATRAPPVQGELTRQQRRHAERKARKAERRGRK